MSGWNDEQTAQKYDDYTKAYSSYQETSSDLVRLAKVAQNHHVIDLACGTGITSQALLEVLGESGHIYAIDLAPAMLAVARKNIQATNISFHHGPAEAVHELIPQPVDRIVCNSAFWQTNGEKTLQSLRKILKPEGTFTFNIPDTFSPIVDEKEQTINLRVLMRQVAEEEFGLTFETPLGERRHSTFSTDNVKQLLERNSYQLIHHERIVYQESRPSAWEFCAIPVMTESALPGVDYETRMKVLECAYNRMETTNDDISGWDFYVVRWLA
jgi:ubiquinone/menaquinone biosynthesis C-methylase UbiE